MGDNTLPCFYCGDMPDYDLHGYHEWSIYFGRVVCSWCWESDEHLDWSDEKHKEFNISPNTWVVPDNYQWPEIKRSIWDKIMAMVKRGAD